MPIELRPWYDEKTRIDSEYRKREETSVMAKVERRPEKGNKKKKIVDYSYLDKYL